MHRPLITLMACLSLGGCYAESLNGSSGRVSSVTLGVPGVLGVTSVSSDDVAGYDQCLKEYGNMPGKEKLCQREVFLSSPEAAQWWCTPYGGWYDPRQAPAVCRADGRVK